MPRIRISTRSNMISVAIVACFLALFRIEVWLGASFAVLTLLAVVWTMALVHGPGLLQHREYCLKRVVKHQWAEDQCRSGILHEDRTTDADVRLLRLTYHAAMRKKWLRAAHRPWEDVPPDPPIPGLLR